jgi:hypothetical protein
MPSISAPGSGDRRRRRACLLACTAVLALGASACFHRPRHHKPDKPTTTTTSEPSTTTTAPAANAVTFELANFSITLTDGELQAGDNEVTAVNVGTAPHDITFIRAESADALPTSENGAVDFSQIPMEDVAGTVEAAAGTSATGTITLTEGDWVAICTVGSTGTNPHFAQGMFLELTVS